MSSSTLPYLGKTGYVVYKSTLSLGEIQQIKKKLTMTPKKTELDITEPFPIYRENENKLYVPRFYGIQTFGAPAINQLSPGIDIDVPFVAALLPLQQKIVKVYLDKVTEDGENGGGGILDVYTGAGKTVMALYILSQLRKKTLILVHKTFLLNQWEERIRQFLPSARVGYIQVEKYQVDGCDIVIAMIQTMNQMNL